MKLNKRRTKTEMFFNDSVDVCCDIRNVESLKKIPVLVLRLFSIMHVLVTTVCVLFLFIPIIRADERVEKHKAGNKKHVIQDRVEREGLLERRWRNETIT